MFRSVVVTLVLGLALGLWIGFNPQMHQKAVQLWENSRASFLKMETQVSTKISTATQGWTSRLQLQHSQTQSKPTSTSQPFAFTLSWRQVSSVFTSWWSSIQKFFLHIKASMHL